MSGWWLVGAGSVLAGAGMTVGVAGAAISRLELVRWISKRLTGATIAGALLTTPWRVLASANALSAIGLLLAGVGLAQQLDRLPPPIAAATLLGIAVPVLVAVGYTLPRAAGRRWPDGIVQVAAPWFERAARVLAPALPNLDAARATALTTALRVGQAEGVFGPNELTVFSGVVAFTERTVREVITPRTDIVAVEQGAPLSEVARIVAESGYSRLPIFRDSLDNIVGMVYAFDLIKVAPDVELPVRPVSMAPASKRCADLLYEMQRDRRQFAVVLDEFGGTAGIATFEDLLEELVGEIFDEHDGQSWPDLPASSLIEIDGATSSAEVAARYGVELPGGAETIGGILAKRIGRIPHSGERFSVAGLEFDVLAATPTRVERLAVRREPVSVVGLAPGELA